MYSRTTLLSRTGMGLRSLAKASAPTRRLRAGLNRPRRTGQRPMGVCRGRRPALRAPTGSEPGWFRRYSGTVRIVPVGKVGDEIQESKSEYVPVRVLLGVESSAGLSKRLPFLPSIVGATLRRALSDTAFTRNSLISRQASSRNFCRTQRVRRVRPERRAQDSTAGCERPARPPYMQC